MVGVVGVVGVPVVIVAMVVAMVGVVALLDVPLAFFLLPPLLYFLGVTI